MRYTLLLILVLIAAGCVGQDTLNNTDGNTYEESYTPEAAARKHAADTYFNRDYAVYKDFSYFTELLDGTTAEVTIRVNNIVNAPSYNLTRIIEQTVTTKKSGDIWVVTSTPPATIIFESYQK